MEATQLVLEPSPYCTLCHSRELCDEQMTARGCLFGGPPFPGLLHPETSDWIDRFAEVDTYSFNTVRAVPQEMPRLPRYVPRVRIDRNVVARPSSAALALPLSEVERLATRVLVEQRSAKSILGLSDNQLLVVLGFEDDSFLENAWARRIRQRILQALTVVGPDLAVAWSYSLWYKHADGWEYPRVENLYNMKRSLVTYQELQRFGIPAVPHVYWGNLSDLDRWSRWLRNNPSVSTISIDLQTADSPSDWRLALQGINRLRGALDRDVSVLFSGVCKLQRLQQIDAIWPACSYTSFAAYFSAVFRYKRMFGLRAVWVSDRELSRSDVFNRAVDEQVAFLADPCRHLRAQPVQDNAFVNDRGQGAAVAEAGGGAVAVLGGPLQFELPLGDLADVAKRKVA